MNIETANVIKYVVQNSPFKDKVKICLDSSEAKGSWFHKLVFEVNENEYVLPHIEHVGKAIGSMFGEGLWVGYFENKLKLVLS
jgi:hypothetical protein